MCLEKAYKIVGSEVLWQGLEAYRVERKSLAAIKNFLTVRIFAFRFNFQSFQEALIYSCFSCIGIVSNVTDFLMDSSVFSYNVSIFRFVRETDFFFN